MPKDNPQTSGGIGTSTLGRECIRFLIGEDTFTDDTQLQGQTHAIKSGSLFHDEIETNIHFYWGWVADNCVATDAAIKTAPHVTTIDLVNNRLVPHAIEPRASTAAYFLNLIDCKKDVFAGYIDGGQLYGSKRLCEH